MAPGRFGGLWKVEILVPMPCQQALPPSGKSVISLRCRDTIVNWDDEDDNGYPASMGCHGGQMPAIAHGQLTWTPADGLC